MDPDRKRRIRLVVALSTAVLLAVALVYTSFSASSEAKQPSDLIGVKDATGSYDLTGKVAEDSVQRSGADMRFEVHDRDDASAAIAVRYSGTVPDPFREGREVIVSGTVVNGVFVAERDSLITKCPSKFAAEAEEDPEHVIIDDSAS